MQWLLSLQIWNRNWAQLLQFWTQVLPISDARFPSILGFFSFREKVLLMVYIKIAEVLLGGKWKTGGSKNRVGILLRM